MATHSSVLAWRIPGMGEPGGLPSMGSHRVGHNWSDAAAAAAAAVIFSKHSGCSNLHSHQQCTRAPFYPHYQHLLLGVFLIITILTGVRWNLIVVLLCISLRTSHAEHLFMCWLAIQMSSLGKCLFKFSAHFFFFLNQVIFFMLNCMHIWDIHPLLDILLTNIFSHSVGSLFVLLIIYFAVQKLFLAWYNSICLFLLLFPLLEETYPKKYY